MPKTDMDKVRDKLNSVKDVHLYIDEETGDIYVYNGVKLVKIGTTKHDPTKNDGPQIGDTPQAGELDDENEERRKQIEQERAEAAARGETLEDDETPEERQQRLDDIQKMFGDEVTKDDLESETYKKVDKDRQRRLQKEKARAKEKAEQARSPLKRFEESLSRFISNQIRREKNKTWKTSNMSYEGSGIMRRGKMTTESKKIPKINVYFDQSASWDSGDIRRGMEAIGVLNNYVKRGEVEIDVFYFANNLHTDPALAREEGGTRAGREVLEHMAETRPDNIIIMTDSDVDRQGDTGSGPDVLVPGAVWFLFRNAESYVLQQKVHGRQQTLKFDITRGM